jgi:hypothetical protein
MNFKTTLLLLVVLLAVGGYVIYDRLSGGADKDKVESAADSKKLFDVKNKDDVNSLTIKSADGSEIVLTKADIKWRMTKPVESAAEAWQVDSLVRDLIDLESRGQVAASPETGLDKPKFNVELSAKGGKLIKFAVGNKTPLGDLFVRVEGHKQADVVSADVYERLGKPANELRDKQLVTVASNDIKQLTIDKDGQKLLLQKKGASWELTEPKKLPADDSTMTDLLGAVTGLRASDWVAKDSPDVAKAMFDKPQMTVVFTTAAPTTQPTTAPSSQPNWTTVTFGQYEDIRHQKLYARISDSQAVVKVAATPIDTLTKRPFELRDKKVLDIIPEQVSKIAILTDLPAGPAPTTKPAKKTQVNIERRKQVAAAPPDTKPAAATTQPSTRPAVATTQPATAPATTQALAAKPEPPPSTWELKSDPKGDADDDSVRNLLTDVHPLRVTKYFESTPTTKPMANYVIDITTEGPGGTPVTAYQIKLTDPGGDQPLHGEYNGLSFELPRTFLTKIEGNFAKKPKAENKTPAINPAEFDLPGDNK